MVRKIYDCANGCPVETTLQVISGKWKCVILFHLLNNEVCRFGELERLMPGCSRRMLALQLKELELDKIIHKDIYSIMPPITEYTLTELGRTLEPVVVEINKWGNKYNQILFKNGNELPVDK